MRKLILIAALVGLSMPAFADDAALLMGVSRYNDLRRVNDGTDILRAAEALGEAGYDVQTLSNGSSRDMLRLLTRFAENASADDRLVVGLSGRFATDGDRSWYLPEDMPAPGPFNMGDAVPVETVLQVLAQAPGQAVLVLGYPQGNFRSFGRYLREGVGALDVPQGVTVIYGEPDLTDNVLTELAEPGANVMAYVRDNGRLVTLGYQPRSLILQPVTSDLPQIEPALQAWNNARDLDTADGYRDFIFDYPRSPFTDEARRRLDEIESDPVRLAELEEDALNLTRDARRAIQRNLTVLDFDTRGVDGIFGPGTRNAIRNWQQENGYAQTSYLTTAQIDRLDLQAERVTAEEARAREEEERERAEAERRERDYWQQTGARGTLDGYRAYLDRYPNGIFAGEARQALSEAAQEDENNAARAAEQALNINPVLRQLIENRLSQLGYDPGQVDGRFDNQTRNAIRRYQSDRGLSATGYLDQATLARLLADTFGR